MAIVTTVGYDSFTKVFQTNHTEGIISNRTIVGLGNGFDDVSESKTYIDAFLRKYFIWFIFAFGFPGNLLSLFVVLRMARRRLTTSLFYVALLAVTDNVAIILKIIENQYKAGQFTMSPIRCQFLFVFGLTLVAYANWILIVMSAERFTAVGFPLKVGLIWPLRRAMAIIGVVFLFLCAVHTHLFFTVGETRNRCSVKPEYKNFFYTWWFFISSSLFAFIPALSILVFNILIIKLMKKSGIKRKALLSRADPAVTELRQQEKQITIMLVTLAVVFILLTVPRCVFVLSLNYWKPKDTAGRARKAFINVLTGVIADSNHAVNFYLYFISGRKFRYHLSKLFSCKAQRRKHSDVSNGLTQLSEMA